MNVRQTNPWNCGSACLAMVLGTTVRDVESNRLKRQVGELRDPAGPGKGGVAATDVIGVTAPEMLCVLADAGIPHLWLLSTSTDETWYGRVMDRLPCVDPFVRVDAHADSGGTAILAVESRTVPGGGHWIVSRGVDLHDPQTGNASRDKLYTKLDKDDPVKLSEAILIRPAPFA